MAVTTTYIIMLTRIRHIYHRTRYIFYIVCVPWVTVRLVTRQTGTGDRFLYMCDTSVPLCDMETVLSPDNVTGRTLPLHNWNPSPLSLQGTLLAVLCRYTAVLPSFAATHQVWLSSAGQESPSQTAGSTDVTPIHRENDCT